MKQAVKQAVKRQKQPFTEALNTIFGILFQDGLRAKEIIMSEEMRDRLFSECPKSKIEKGIKTIDVFDDGVGLIKVFKNQACHFQIIVEPI